MKGIVSYFDPETGRGEIESSDGPVLFKASALAQKRTSVAVGAKVGFKQTNKGQGPVATNIIVIEE